MSTLLAPSVAKAYLAWPGRTWLVPGPPDAIPAVFSASKSLRGAGDPFPPAWLCMVSEPPEVGMRHRGCWRCPVWC